MRSLRKAPSASIPVLLDETQLVSESLQLTRAGEVLVIDPKGWKVAYRGPLDKAKAGNALLTGALDAVLAGQPVRRRRSPTRGCARESCEAGPCRREGLVLRADRADADRQLRHLPPRRRHRPVADDELRHHQRLRADDPRSRAHQAHAAVACGPARRRVGRRPLADASRKSRRWCTGSKPARRAARARIRWPICTRPGVSGRSASPTWWSSCRRSTCQRPASSTTSATSSPTSSGRDVWVRATDMIPGDRTVVHHVIAGVYDPKHCRSGSA